LAGTLCTAVFPVAPWTRHISHRVVRLDPALSLRSWAGTCSGLPPGPQESRLISFWSQRWWTLVLLHRRDRHRLDCQRVANFILSSKGQACHSWRMVRAIPWTYLSKPPASWVRLRHFSGCPLTPHSPDSILQFFKPIHCFH
jgi:hypothetical protein